MSESKHLTCPHWSPSLWLSTCLPPAVATPASLDPIPSLSYPPPPSFSLLRPLYPSSHLPFGQPLQQNRPYLFCESLAHSHGPGGLPWPWPAGSSSSSSKRAWGTCAADPWVAPRLLLHSRAVASAFLGFWAEWGAHGRGSGASFLIGLQTQLTQHNPLSALHPLPLQSSRPGHPAPLHAFRDMEAPRPLFNPERVLPLSGRARPNLTRSVGGGNPALREVGV